MYCSACGQSQPVFARFCSACGATLQPPSPRPSLRGPTVGATPWAGSGTPPPPATGAAPSLTGNQTQMHAHAADIMVGRQLGSYRIERKLGEGGMGAVFLATQLKLDRQVAVKVLPPLLSRDAGLIQRFEREARALAGVESPYIVPIHDLFEVHGMFCIAMGYAAGGSLADLLRQGPVAEERARELIRQAALGLHEAHVQKGIVHRDIKPDNLLLTSSGRVQIADFGLAKAMAESSGLTRSGSLMGTPAFMSPEQFRDSRAVDHRSDLYALGCTLFALLTGAPPFPGPTPATYMHQHLHAPLPALPARLSPGMAGVLQRLLQKDPAQRYPDAAALAAALASLPAGDATSASAGSVHPSVPPSAPPSEPARPPSPTPRSASAAPARIPAELPGAPARPPARAEQPAARPAKRPPTPTSKARRRRFPWGVAVLLLVLTAAAGVVAWLQPWRTVPRLRALQPAEGSLLASARLRLSGRLVGDDLPLSLHVQQTRGEVAADGSFSLELPLEEGENLLLLRAGELQQTLRYTLDSVRPELQLLSPRADTVVGLAGVQVRVAAQDERLEQVLIDRLQVPATAGGLYSRTLQKPAGSHRIEVEARDRAGNKRIQTFQLVVDGQGPVLHPEVISSAGSLQIEVSADEWITRLELDDGQVFPGGKPPLRIELTPEQGAGELWLTAWDRHGNSSRASVSYNMSELLRGLQACDWWWAPDLQWQVGQNLDLPVAVKNTLGQRMVLVPPGSFTMGTSEKDPDRADGEIEHQVRFDVPFYLAAHELDRAIWHQLMGGAAEGPELAAGDLSWFDAIEFCNRLSEREGLEPAYLLEDVERGADDHIIAARVVWLGHDRTGYRLPSEAEWEYACKAGEGGVQGTLEEIAWFQGNAEAVHRPGQKPANPWGLYDMLGNVWEWCWDTWHPYGSRSRRDPRGPLPGEDRIARGGGYVNSREYVRPGQRAAEAPDVALPHLGLRLARSLPRPMPLELFSVEQLVAANRLGVAASWREGLGRQMVLIPAGSFAGPGGRVTISRAFAMQRHEVTQSQWWALMGTRPATFAQADAAAPVESINWFEALLYCNRLSEQAGLAPFYELRDLQYDEQGRVAYAQVVAQPLSAPGYRLPTEAEWEYACRAGTSTATWRGELKATGLAVPELGELAWYGGNSGYVASDGWAASTSAMEEPADTVGPQPVGGRAANPWGLFGMLGNVSEWTWDAESARSLHPVRDPSGPLWGSRRVVRGGAFLSPAEQCTADQRQAVEVAERRGDVGLRPVRTLSGEDPPWAPAFDQLVAANQLGIPVAAQSPCGLELALVPAGTYRRGSPVTEAGRNDDETPHPVTISRAFYIGRSEISQEMWLRVMGSAVPSFELAGAAAPMEGMNWFEAVEFCNRLSDLEGLPHAYQISDIEVGEAGGIDGARVTFLGLQSRGYRLPSEAEWEYACRAGSEGPLYRGELVIVADRTAPALDPLAFHAGNSALPFEGTDARDWEGRAQPYDWAGTHVVASKLPNAWGLYDMLGNVQEWCFDGYAAYGEEAVLDPYRDTGETRIARGGSYFNLVRWCRAAARNHEAPGDRFKNVGLRVVRSAP